MPHPLVLQQRRAAHIARDIQAGRPDVSNDDLFEDASIMGSSELQPSLSEVVKPQHTVTSLPSLEIPSILDSMFDTASQQYSFLNSPSPSGISTPTQCPFDTPFTSWNDLIPVPMLDEQNDFDPSVILLAPQTLYEDEEFRGILTNEGEDPSPNEPSSPTTNLLDSPSGQSSAESPLRSPSSSLVKRSTSTRRRTPLARPNGSCNRCKKYRIKCAVSLKAREGDTCIKCAESGSDCIFTNPTPRRNSLRSLSRRGGRGSSNEFPSSKESVPSPPNSSPVSYNPPELITQQIITHDEVINLFQLYYEKMNNPPVLDPEIHTVSYCLMCCPLLFTAICTVASLNYSVRPDLYDIALPYARAAAARAFSVEGGGCGAGDEVVFALKLLSRWTRSTIGSQWSFV